MLQSILDLYPDGISQYGLVGCAFATYAVLAPMVAIWRLVTIPFRY
jgi:hypothetical protein